MSRIEALQECYYNKRAAEYDDSANYQREEFAAIMAPVRARYQLALQGRDVLEIACGPGYWTEAVAVTAHSILATDLDPGLVSMVRNRLAGVSSVRCEVASAYTLEGVSGRFDAAFAQFWWSHMPHSRIRSFLTTLHGRLLPGSTVMFLDSLPRSFGGRWLDDNGDLIEERRLRNGTRFEIIKNLPTKREMMAALDGIAEEIDYKQFRADGYWTVSYRTKGPSLAQDH